MELLLSGQIPLTPEGELVSGIERDQAGFGQWKDFEAAGSNKGNILEVTIYLTDSATSKKSMLCMKNGWGGSQTSQSGG